jgi:hypothetical protein
MKLIQDLNLIYLRRWGTERAQRLGERMILVLAHILLVGDTLRVDSQKSDTPYSIQGTSVFLTPTSW